MDNEESLKAISDLQENIKYLYGEISLLSKMIDDLREDQLKINRDLRDLRECTGHPFF